MAGGRQLYLFHLAFILLVTTMSLVARKRSRKRLSSKLPEAGYDLKRGNGSQGERKGVYSWASQTRELPSEPFTVAGQELLSSMGSETSEKTCHTQRTAPWRTDATRILLFAVHRDLRKVKKWHGIENANSDAPPPVLHSIAAWPYRI